MKTQMFYDAMSIATIAADSRDGRIISSNECFERAFADLSEAELRALLEEIKQKSEGLDACTFTRPLPVFSEERDVKIIVQKSPARNQLLISFNWDRNLNPSLYDFFLTAEAVPCGILVVHVRPDMFYAKHVSNGLLEMLGLTREEYVRLSKNDILYFIYEEDVEEGLRQFYEAAGKDGKFYLTGRLVTKDGSLIWVNFMGRAVTHIDGEIYLYTIITQIDDSLSVVEKLYREQQTSFALEQFSPDLILRYDLKLDTVRFSGGLLEKLTGKRTASYALPDFLAGKSELKADPRQVEEAVSRMRRGEKTEMHFTLPDLEGALRTLSLDYDFIYLEPGEAVSVVGRLTDITDLLEAKDYYDRALALWHNHSGDAPAAVTLNLSKGRVVDGYSLLPVQGRLENMPLADYLDTLEKYMVHPEEMQKLRAFLDKDHFTAFVRTYQDRMRLECQFKSEGQDYRWVRLSVQLLSNPHTNDYMALLRCDDVNDIKLRKSIDHLLYSETFEYIGIIFLKTNRYMVISAGGRKRSFSNRLKENYERMTRRMVSRYAFPDNRSYLNYCFSIKNLRSVFEGHKDYEFLVRGKGKGGKEVLREIRFQMLDAKRQLLLLTVRDVSKRTEMLHFKTTDALVRTPFEEIQYIESAGRKSMVYTHKETLEANEMISALAERLPGREFMRCHRCYIVRLDEIREISGYDAVLKNGEQIPVSRKLMGKLKKKLAARPN